MLERKWPTVITSIISVANHILTVTSTDGLHDKQLITLSKSPQEPIDLEVKRVLSATTLQVGNKSPDMENLVNPTAYAGGLLTMSEQNRNPMGGDIVLRAVYEEGPAVALRSLLVDKLGNRIDSIRDIDGVNRLAVSADLSISHVDIDADALTPPTRPDPDNILIAGSEDGTKGGLKHAARVDADLDLRVGVSNGANKMTVNVDGSINARNINNLVKVPYDSVQMDYDPVTQDMTQARFYLGVTLVQTLDFTYDTYLNLTEVA